MPQIWLLKSWSHRKIQLGINISLILTNIQSHWRQIYVSLLSQSALQCKNEEEMECSLCVLYNEYFYKSKCPRPCSIVQYSGRIDYWERKDSNLNDFSFRLSFRFASPAKTKVYQEYLVYNFFDLFGSVGAIFGIFIGFFLSSLFNFLNNVLKKHDSNIQDSKLSLPKFYNISQNCY